MRIHILSLCLLLWAGLSAKGAPVKLAVQTGESDLHFNEVAKTWDEGMPLGNAVVGALVWQKGEALRFSLDRTDLWDLRSMDSLQGPRFKFRWVKEQIRRRDYAPVQKKLDVPYDRDPAPAKIPGAALEFRFSGNPHVSDIRVALQNAVCIAQWDNGMSLQTFVHATRPVGWFIFQHVQGDVTPQISMPRYATEKKAGESSPVSGQDLSRLGYEQGTVSQQGDVTVYHQKGYGGFYYDVALIWRRVGDSLYGVWSVTTSLSTEQAVNEVREAFARGVAADYKTHMKYWDGFWAQSSLQLPDPVLQKQYDNEMYKLGSTSRAYSYPISLQAIWTADNGHLPPWKGDYHHDLNTQLSYWPAYTSNHLYEALGYVNTLWKQRETYREYTRDYFEHDGINVPGVCTLDGRPMGGWSQYSLSQTIGCWLAQHFYLQWRYSMNRDFLREKAYPFIKDVATYMEQQTVMKNGVRTLEYSSSPEINDNSLEAWFPTVTNFDLALMKFIFKVAAETAEVMGQPQESTHWKQVGSQLPDFDIDSDGALTFAHGHPYNVSHRHFSHAMAIHPLGLINWSDGKKAQDIITATLKKLHKYGPSGWCGYSYSWLGNMEARAMHGEEAAEALRTFAQCFCLKNTFHANGDQSGTGKSGFTYRPFTLEGNFAFASGIQEMLLQSHTGVIRVFPAIPKSWKDVSFQKLRAQGAFLVTATRKAGRVTRLTVYSEKGGTLNIVNPNTGKTQHYQTRSGQTIRVI